MSEFNRHLERSEYPLQRILALRKEDYPHGVRLVRAERMASHFRAMTEATPAVLEGYIHRDVALGEPIILRPWKDLLDAYIANPSMHQTGIVEQTVRSEKDFHVKTGDDVWYYVFARGPKQGRLENFQKCSPTVRHILYGTLVAAAAILGSAGVMSIMQSQQEQQQDAVEK